jgi:hypothetical protein
MDRLQKPIPLVATCGTTRYQANFALLIIFEASSRVWMTGGPIQLLSSDILGEGPKGKRTALFPDLDLSMRAVLLSLRLDVFAIKRAPQSQPAQ